MKIASIVLALGLLIGAAGNATAQDKKNWNSYSKKKFWEQEEWAFTKLAVHYKVVTSEVALGGKKNQNVSAKSWAMLDGVSEATFQEITDEFAKRFRARIKQEFGKESKTWNDIKGAAAVAKIVEKQDPKTHMKKSEGAAVICTADDGPFFHRVGGFAKGGKKLGKELGAALIEMDVILDFALFETAIASTKTYGWDVTTINTRIEQGVAPIMFVSPMFGGTMDMRTSNWNGNNMQSSGIFISASNNTTPVKSDKEYAQSVETHKGQMPSIMTRKFNLTKPSTSSTFLVKTTDEAYKAAALDALDAWMEGLIGEMKAMKK